MELKPLANTTLNTAVTHAGAQLDAATMEEILCALVIPLLALFIGIRANRFIARRPQQTIGHRFIDFTAPLLSPLLAVIFCLIALATFKTLGLAPAILPFVAKLAIAWVAIQFVVLMSTRRMAGWFIAFVIIPITLLHLFGIWDATEEVLASVKFSLGNVQLNLFLILKGVMAIIAMQWMASFVVRTTDKRLRRMSVRASNRALILKLFQFILYTLIFLIGIQLIGVNLTALSVFGGAFGVGLGFGLQRTASNFISGIVLLFEKSVEVDDMIELADGTTGFIRQTHARYTLLELADGREMLIPNEEFISQRVTSWTHSNKKARVEIKLLVDYKTDVELARRLMLDAAHAHPRTLKSKDTMCNLTNFADNGIELQLFFWVADVTVGRIEPKSDIMVAILTAFLTHGITIASPRREVHLSADAAETVRS